MNATATAAVAHVPTMSPRACWCDVGGPSWVPCLFVRVAGEGDAEVRTLLHGCGSVGVRTVCAERIGATLLFCVGRSEER
jgi:hypothetical protein